MTTCSIITTAANELMSTIHNSKKRMPLVLEESAWSVWLDEKSKPGDIKQVMIPFKENELDAHEISKLVTSRGAETDVPEVQQGL